MLRAAAAAALIALAIVGTAHALLPPVLSPDTTITDAPPATTTETSASFSFESNMSGSSFECRLDGSAWTDCTSPTTYAGLATGQHVFEVRATDFLGDTDSTPARHEWTITRPPDTTPPQTTIDNGPSGTTTQTTASFSFSSSESGSTFACRLDGGAWGGCSSPKSYSGLAAGTHTFDVRATDAAGNVDATPASRSWTVGSADTTPPDTTITAGPSGSTTATSASFSFSSSETGSSFECKLDAGAWGACTSPKAYSGLSAGSHTFSVRAKDAAGNVDASPASRSWTITGSPSSINCDKTQNAGESVSAFLTRLGANAEGCLLAGSYSVGNLNSFQSGQKLHPAAAAGGGYQRVTIRGTLSLQRDSIVLNDLFIVGVQNSQNTKIIELGACANCRLDHLDVTSDPPNVAFNGILNYADAPGLQITSNRIHHIGGNGQFDHGIYCAHRITGGFIRGNWIYANASFGIQFYPDCDSADFSYNMLDDNGTLASCAQNTTCGTSSSNGRGLIYAGEGSQHSDGVNAHNNVLSTFGGAGRSLVACYLPGSGGRLDNSLLYQASGSDDSCGSSISRSGVMHGQNPLYVNRTGRDYRLQSGSPARSLMGSYADAVPGPRS
jgi:hypothetical protein